MTIGAWIWAGLFFIGILLFYLYYRGRAFFRCLLFTTLTGEAALGLVWLLGHFFPCVWR